MAEDPQVKPDKGAERSAARGTQSRPDATPEEVRYSIDDLRDNPRLLGPDVNRHAIAGAFAGAERKTFTLAQAADRVKKFLKRVPEPDTPEGEA